MRIHVTLFVFVAVIGNFALTPLAGAHAETVKQPACAGQLTKTGRIMFDAVAPHVKPKSNIKALIQDYVRPLVMGGRIDMQEAQRNGPAVAKCLDELKTSTTAPN